MSEPNERPEHFLICIEFEEEQLYELVPPAGHHENDEMRTVRVWDSTGATWLVPREKLINLKYNNKGGSERG